MMFFAGDMVKHSCFDEIKHVVKKFKDKKVSFLFVGVLNAVFGCGGYALFIFFKMHYFITQLFGSILAITHSYLWNKYFTFRRHEKSCSETARFVSAYALSYLLNMAVRYISIEKFKMTRTSQA